MWTSPDCQYRSQIDYILYSWRRRSSKQWAKTRPGADCSSDHELLIVQFRLKLKKVGKTTRPFSYDLNQIPYDYTLEVTNRFKGLDLIDRVPEKIWTKIITLYRRQCSIPPPRKRNAKNKMVVWRGLTNSWEKKRYERQSRKGKIYPSECRDPKDKKAFLSKQCKEIEENTRKD